MLIDVARTESSTPISAQASTNLAGSPIWPTFSLGRESTSGRKPLPPGYPASASSRAASSTSRSRPRSWEWPRAAGGSRPPNARTEAPRSSIGRSARLQGLPEHRVLERAVVR